MNRDSCERLQGNSPQMVEAEKLQDAVWLLRNTRGREEEREEEEPGPSGVGSEPVAVSSLFARNQNGCCDVQSYGDTNAEVEHFTDVSEISLIIFGNFTENV
ncbi:hypothetical protein F2P81_026310 [Scophthalmus maximus]|uniref:Uncharacterized protein n=1 Tax=Scophthalmus maximus TaxID=52904 RepID=A0A6A4RMQ0_SCOMX|nr:hypothetical protein F2P81_026310 [Scophthalmus maximus]